MPVKWLSTIKHADGGRLALEPMALDETGFLQPTGDLEDGHCRPSAPIAGVPLVPRPPPPVVARAPLARCVRP